MSLTERAGRRREAEGILRFWKGARGYAGAYDALSRHLEERVAALGGDPEAVIPRSKRRAKTEGVQG